GEAVSAEILELKGVVSWGRDLEHAFAMVTEAAECIVGACATSATDSIARLAIANIFFAAASFSLSDTAAKTPATPHSKSIAAGIIFSKLLKKRAMILSFHLRNNYMKYLECLKYLKLKSLTLSTPNSSSLQSFFNFKYSKL
ncbi:MAG: hypothetical protein NT066_07190, partial [Candidatus Omnitrophica bacterium]|nr:hypothetical protein [Candidatus Omnitrophota bacterium]